MFSVVKEKIAYKYLEKIVKNKTKIIKTELKYLSVEQDKKNIFFIWKTLQEHFRLYFGSVFIFLSNIEKKDACRKRHHKSYQKMVDKIYFQFECSGKF